MRSIKADAMAEIIQKKVNQAAGHTGPVNSFEPEQTPEHRKIAGGHGLYNDLCYEETFPNSFLDLYLPENRTEGKRPVVLYAHGGGFLFLGKGTGDAIAQAIQGTGSDEADTHDEITGFSGMIRQFLDAGIAVASMEYAMAPEYRFPVAILQMDRAAGFLSAHAGEYGLDPDRFVLMGSSAGADMVEILSLAICDPDYAKALGIEQTALTRSQVACSVIDESALLPGKPPYEGDNYYVLDAVWMGEEALDHCPQKKLSYVPDHIRNTYIPCHINACNAEQWFYDSTYPLHQRLDEIGIENVFFYPPREEGVEQHGYMMNYATDTNARLCWRSTFDFIRDHL